LKDIIEKCLCSRNCIDLFLDLHGDFWNYKWDYNKPWIVINCPLFNPQRRGDREIRGGKMRNDTVFKESWINYLSPADIKKGEKLFPEAINTGKTLFGCSVKISYDIPNNETWLYLGKDLFAKLINIGESPKKAK